jgi:hypothetical protein
MSAPHAEVMPEATPETATPIVTAEETLERPNFLGDHASFLRCPDYH